MPKRVQLRREKGWRKPEGCIVVARPTRWGNPYRVGAGDAGYSVQYRPSRWRSDNDGPPVGCWPEEEGAARFAVDCYRAWLDRLYETDFSPLRGHDLACWCPPHLPCHADVLLELANK